jgi:hypothetical protein
VEFYAGMTYSWYNEYSQLIGTSNEPHFTVTKNGNYRLRVSDGYCDSYSTWIPVTLNYKPEAKILQGKNTVFCQSGTLFAKKINGATYSWSKDGVTIGEGEAINVNESGKYTLTVNKFGCTNTFETDVVINKIPDSFDISAENAAICPGEKTRISVSEISGATNYMWYRNGRTYRYTTANSVEIKQKGTYTVRVYFGENCGIDALVSIEVEELDAPRVRPVITTDLKINLENAAGMTYSTVKWFLYGDELTSFANQASIKPTEAGLYKAVVTYGTGCEVFSGSIYFGISGTDDEEKNPNEIRFLLYPNPTKGDLYITMNSKTTVSVNVLDQLGRILMVKEFTAEEVQNTAKLDLSALPSGVFMVKVTANGITTVRKITRD